MFPFKLSVLTHRLTPKGDGLTEAIIPDANEVHLPVVLSQEAVPQTPG